MDVLDWHACLRSMIISVKFPMKIVAVRENVAKVPINQGKLSDDPAEFGGYSLDGYTRIHTGLSLPSVTSHCHLSLSPQTVTSLGGGLCVGDRHTVSDTKATPPLGGDTLR